MIDPLITKLRNIQTSREGFRKAAHQIARLLAQSAISYLEQEPLTIETPLVLTQGTRLKNEVVLIPVLRAGLAMLPAFYEYFPNAATGMLGLKRDEKTAIPYHYYTSLPKIRMTDDVLILEPMLATGNTVSRVIELLTQEHGVRLEKILLCCLISAPEGEEKIAIRFPALKYIVMQKDHSLNAQKFIVPGLGDFGDRYFGTENDPFS